MKNRLKMGGGEKQVVLLFRWQELWKCFVRVLSAGTYWKKGHKLWIEIPKYFGDKSPTKLRIYFRGNTNLYQVCCDLYRPFYIYTCH